jgi:hypothetical protein
MFFLTKLIFKFIVIPILMTLLIPIIILLLMYQPLDFYYEAREDLSRVEIETVISEGLNAYLEENNQEFIGFSIQETQLNYYILEVLKQTNPNLNVNDTYVIEEDLYGYAGSWFEFRDDEIQFISKLDIFVLSTFTYETSLRLIFDLEIEGQEVILTIKNIYLGNLPILWMLDVVDFGLNIFGIDIETEISNILNQFGVYNQDEKSISWSVPNLLSASFIEEATISWITLILENIEKNELLEIISDNQSLSIVIYIQKLQDPSEVKTLSPPSNNDTYESILNEWVSTIEYVDIFQSILNADELTTLQYNIYMNERQLNQILNVALNDTFPNTIAFNGFNIEFSKPYIMIEDDLWIEVPLRILNEENDSVFETKIIIQSTLVYEEDKGYIVFEKIKLGQTEFDGEILSLLFELLGVTLENNQLEITTILTMIEDDLNIKNISIVGNRIQITTQPETVIQIDTLKETVESLIEALSNIESLPEDIQNGLQAITDAILTNDVDAINQAFEEYMMTYEALDDTIQSEIQALIYAYLEENASLDAILN